MARPRLKVAKADAGFAVGDRVRVQFYASTMPVEIIEDRGHLGVGGRQIFRVRTRDASLDEQTSFEIPADALIPDPGPKVAI